MRARSGAGTLSEIHPQVEGCFVKSSLLMGFRAIAFAIGAFILLAISGIRVQSSMDVFMFVIGLVVFWVVIEMVFLNMKKKKTVKPPRAH